MKFHGLVQQRVHPLLCFLIGLCIDLFQGVGHRLQVPPPFLEFLQNPWRPELLNLCILLLQFFGNLLPKGRHGVFILFRIQFQGDQSKEVEPVIQGSPTRHEVRQLPTRHLTPGQSAFDALVEDTSQPHRPPHRIHQQPHVLQLNGQSGDSAKTVHHLLHRTQTITPLLPFYVLAKQSLQPPQPSTPQSNGLHGMRESMAPTVHLERRFRRAVQIGQSLGHQQHIRLGLNRQQKRGKALVIKHELAGFRAVEP